MGEEKDILEKRSSFKGWKERNKERVGKKRKIVGVIIILSVFSAMLAYPYINNLGDDGDKDNVNASLSTGKNDTNGSKIDSGSKTGSSKVDSGGKTGSGKVDSGSKTGNDSKTGKTNTSQTVVGKIGVPVISNGFEIIIKSVSMTELRTTAWMTVKNKDNYEKPFKIGLGTSILDNEGQQYENIRVVRSAEIAQTNLSGDAMREGAIFFERIKDGRNPKRLTLNINNNKVEFILDSK